MKRISVMILIPIAMVLFMSACSSSDKEESSKKPLDEGDENINESGMPIVNKPIDLTFFAGKSPSSADNWNDVLVWNEYEERSNINVKWDMVPFSTLGEKVKLLLASGDYPDAFFNARLSPKDLSKYGKQGIFLELNDLIDKYAPNLSKILKEQPSIKSAMTFPDGSIYGLPLLMDPDNPNIRIAEHFWIREDWLDALDMKMPETTEEYYQYLKAVKEQDPNGNGKADEIPFGGNGIGGLINQLKGAWGLGNRGVSSRYVDIDPDTNEPRFIYTDPKYKELLQYLNKLYSEELIEQNIYTIEHTQYMANASEKKYGSVSSVNTEAIEGSEDFDSAPPFEGPDGDRIFIRVFNPVTGLGSFAITNKNEHPVATMKWIDYFYGDEGMKLYFMGVEGKTFEEKSNGELEFVEEITDNPDGLTFDQAVAQYLTYPGGGHPGFMKKEYDKASENQPAAIKAMEKSEPFLPDEIWPEFTSTDKEYKELSRITVDMNSYTSEMEAKFITGKLPFSKWDEYVEELNKIGVDKYMEIEKAALKRYKQKK